MNSMKFKKTRIAFSVFFGILSLLLIGLWVRSYLRKDGLELPLAHSYFVECYSEKGGLSLVYGEGAVNLQLDTFATPYWSGGELINLAHFGYNDKNRMLSLAFPHWFPIICLSVLAATPWVRWSQQFSLRSLFIAMTAIAVSLGFIAWAAQR